MSPNMLKNEGHMILENRFESGSNGGELNVGIGETRGLGDGGGVGAVIADVNLGNRVEREVLERH